MSDSNITPLTAYDEKKLKEFIERLREFFDTVDIVVTRHDDSTEETFAGRVGSGNKLARNAALLKIADDVVNVDCMHDLGIQDEGSEQP